MSSSLCSVRQCSVCCSIDFRKYLREKRLLAIPLGSWEDICKEKRCRFCRLVRDAIFLHAHKPSPESIIKLSNKRSWKCCTSYNEYHGIRWKAYSNEFDLQAYAKETQTDSRYQFFVYWDLESTEIIEVLLRPLCDGPFFGRAVDEITQIWLCVANGWKRAITITPDRLGSVSARRVREDSSEKIFA
jgi:hypothetical protein